MDLVGSPPMRYCGCCAGWVDGAPTVIFGGSIGDAADRDGPLPYFAQGPSPVAVVPLLVYLSHGPLTS